MRRAGLWYISVLIPHTINYLYWGSCLSTRNWCTISKEPILGFAVVFFVFCASAWQILSGLIRPTSWYYLSTTGSRSNSYCTSNSTEGIIWNYDTFYLIVKRCIPSKILAVFKLVPEATSITISCLVKYPTTCEDKEPKTLCPLPPSVRSYLIVVFAAQLSAAIAQLLTLSIVALESEVRLG